MQTSDQFDFKISWDQYGAIRYENAKVLGNKNKLLFLSPNFFGFPFPLYLFNSSFFNFSRRDLYLSYCCASPLLDYK